MFISPAFAQAASGGGGGDILGAILPLIAIFAVFYFLLIRPQQKKHKAHQAMIGAVRRGDRVVLGGGIIGTVTKAGEGEQIDVEIAQGVRVKVMQSTLSSVVSKTEPASKAMSKTEPASKADDK